MIKIVNANLMEAKESIIGHQVNCKGVMGSGVALQVKTKFPEAFIAYKTLVDRVKDSPFDTSTLLLGGSQIVKCKNGKYIANLFGQDSYGTDRKNTSEEKLFEALTELYEFAKESNLTVALPWKLGCCRGGGNWEEVYGFLKELFKDDADLVIYKLDLN